MQNELRLNSLNSLLEQSIKVRDDKVMEFLLTQKNEALVKQTISNFTGNMGETLSYILNIMQCKVNLIFGGLVWIKWILRTRPEVLKGDDQLLQKIKSFYLFSENREERRRNFSRLSESLANFNKNIKIRTSETNTNEQELSTRAFGKAEVVVYDEDETQEEERERQESEMELESLDDSITEEEEAEFGRDSEELEELYEAELKRKKSGENGVLEGVLDEKESIEEEDELP